MTHSKMGDAILYQKEHGGTFKTADSTEYNSNPMNKTSLFNPAPHNEHAFELDCDILSDESIATIAKFIADRTEFGIVQGISKDGCRRTGCRLADALEEYAVWEAPFNVLIVDDVLVDGTAMIKAREEQPPEVHPSDVVGWVIFAMTEPPAWVQTVFKLDSNCKETTR